jgi:hypothetical protein
MNKLHSKCQSVCLDRCLRSNKATDSWQRKNPCKNNDFSTSTHIMLVYALYRDFSFPVEFGDTSFCLEALFSLLKFNEHLICLRLLNLRWRCVLTLDMRQRDMKTGFNYRWQWTKWLRNAPLSEAVEHVAKCKTVYHRLRFHTADNTLNEPTRKASKS